MQEVPELGDDQCTEYLRIRIDRWNSFARTEMAIAVTS